MEMHAAHDMETGIIQSLLGIGFPNSRGPFWGVAITGIMVVWIVCCVPLCRETTK